MYYRRGAIFFARINNISIRGNIGRGERIADAFFLTNDSDTIRNVIPDAFKTAIGSLEYNSFIQSPLAAYSFLGDLNSKEEMPALVSKLTQLDIFEAIFWMHADSCVGHEIGFLINR